LEHAISENFVENLWTFKLIDGFFIRKHGLQDIFNYLSNKTHTVFLINIFCIFDSKILEKVFLNKEGDIVIGKNSKEFE
jgi:hypothetical protein